MFTHCLQFMDIFTKCLHFRRANRVSSLPRNMGFARIRTHNAHIFNKETFGKCWKTALQSKTPVLEYKRKHPFGGTYETV